jgi:hypothetical protein
MTKDQLQQQLQVEPQICQRIWEQCSGSIEQQVNQAIRGQALRQVEWPNWWQVMREFMQHTERQSQLAVEDKS